MKKLLRMLLLSVSISGFSQSLDSYLIGSAGGGLQNPSVGSASFSVGEISATAQSTSGLYSYSGFHQPFMPIPCELPGHRKASAVVPVSGDAAAMLLSWDEASPIGKYRLRFSKSTPESFTFFDVEGTSVLMDDLELGTDYRWSVISYCTETEFNGSLNSNNQVFTTNGAPECLVPTDFESLNASSTSVTLSWTGNGDYYRLRYERPSGGWTYLTLDPEEVPVTVEGLQANHNYRFQLKSFCGGTSTSWIQIQSWTDAAKMGVKELNGVELYPNPSMAGFQLSLPGDVLTDIHVLDLTGQQVFSTRAAEGQTAVLFGEDFLPGVYTLILTNQQTNTTITLYKAD